MRSRALLSPAAFAVALLTAAPALGVAPSSRVIWIGLCGGHGAVRQRLPADRDEDRGRAAAGCHSLLCGGRGRPGRRRT